MYVCIYIHIHQSERDVQSELKNVDNALKIRMFLKMKILYIV